MKREQAVDVAVIGGGPAGSILATLVDAFYHTKLITTLAGDLWRDDNQFQNRLLSSPRRSFQVEQSSTGIARPF